MKYKIFLKEPLGDQHFIECEEYEIDKSEGAVIYTIKNDVSVDETTETGWVPLGNLLAIKIMQ